MTDPGTVTEWGVRYAHDGSVHVDSHGPSEALARCAVDTYKAITTVPRQDVTLVTRQVQYGEWGEPGEEVLMSGFPLHARFAHPDAGWAGDREQAARWLTPGHVYTVQALQVGRSASTLSLYEVPGEWFNTVLFEPDHGPSTADDEEQEEVTDVNEPDPEQVAEEQDQAAEASQDDEQAEPAVHEANPF